MKKRSTKKKSTKVKNPTKQLKAIAYHEAGHAFACWKLGVGIRSVTIKPDADSLGYVHHNNVIKNDGRNSNSMRTRISFENDILISLAGPEAERRFAGRTNHDSAWGDFKHASYSANLIGGDGAGADLFLKWMSYRAKDLVTKNGNWRAIRALASELLKKETLKGKEIKEIFEEIEG